MEDLEAEEKLPAKIEDTAVKDEIELKPSTLGESITAEGDEPKQPMAEEETKKEEVKETAAPEEDEKQEVKKLARKPSPSEVHPMGRPSIGDDLDEQRSHVSSRESSRSLRGNKLKAVISTEEQSQLSPRDQQADPKLAEMVVSGSQPSSRKGERKSAAKTDDVTAEKIIREVSQANETEGALSPSQQVEDKLS